MSLTANRPKGGKSENDSTHMGLDGTRVIKSGVTGLDEFGVFFSSFAGTAIAFLLDFGELTCDVGSMAIEHWGVTVTDLARMVKNDDLSEEVGSATWWVGFRISSDETTTKFLNRDVLNVEPDVVARESFSECFVMHLD